MSFYVYLVISKVILNNVDSQIKEDIFTGKNTDKAGETEKITSNC